MECSHWLERPDRKVLHWVFPFLKGVSKVDILFIHCICLTASVIGYLPDSIFFFIPSQYKNVSNCLFSHKTVSGLGQVHFHLINTSNHLKFMNFHFPNCFSRGLFPLSSSTGAFCTLDGWNRTVIDFPLPPCCSWGIIVFSAQGFSEHSRNSRCVAQIRCGPACLISCMLRARLNCLQSGNVMMTTMMMMVVQMCISECHRNSAGSRKSLWHFSMLPSVDFSRLTHIFCEVLQGKTVQHKPPPAICGHTYAFGSHVCRKLSFHGLHRCPIRTHVWKYGDSARALFILIEISEKGRTVWRVFSPITCSSSSVLLFFLVLLSMLRIKDVSFVMPTMLLQMLQASSGVQECSTTLNAKWDLSPLVLIPHLLSLTFHNT